MLLKTAIAFLCKKKELFTRQTLSLSGPSREANNYWFLKASYFWFHIQGQVTDISYFTERQEWRDLLCHCAVSYYLTTSSFSNEHLQSQVWWAELQKWKSRGGKHGTDFETNRRGIRIQLPQAWQISRRS